MLLVLRPYHSTTPWPPVHECSCGRNISLVTNEVSTGKYLGPLNPKRLKLNVETRLLINWLVVSIPLKNLKVSWDDDIPNIWKHKIHVPNHQPLIYYPIMIPFWHVSIDPIHILFSYYLIRFWSHWTSMLINFGAGLVYHLSSFTCC